MNNIYLYIYQYNGEYLLVIETFILKYKMYVLKWILNSEDFISIVNKLNIIHINKGVNHFDCFLIDYSKESKILNVVLDSIINKRKYIILKYDFR